MSLIKKQIFSLLLLLFILLTVGFIWGNSLLDRAQSTELSMGVLDYLEPLLETFGLDTSDDHALRKFAHFAEFGLLGVELALLAFLRKGLKLRAYALSAAFSLFVAVSDETIQLFSGRAFQITDMMLDFSGSLCGIFGIWFVAALLEKRKNKRIGIS